MDDNQHHRRQHPDPRPARSLLERMQGPAARKGMEAAFNASPAALGLASLREIAGIAEDHGPLIDDIPVSESPDLYLLPPIRQRPTTQSGTSPSTHRNAPSSR